MRRPTAGSARARFAIFAAALDIAAVTASATVVGVAYHALVYRLWGMGEASSGFGLAMAALFAVLSAFRNEYAALNYLNFAGHGRRVFFVWNITFLLALVFMFAVKETEVVSRASALLFYLAGFTVLILTRAALVRRIGRLAAGGRIVLSRAVLVGTEAELRAFLDRYQPAGVGVEVIASAVLRQAAGLAAGAAACSASAAASAPGADTLGDDLALAAAIARVLRPDDVFILCPWHCPEVIEAALDALVNVPAAIHLGPQPVLDRFTKANVSRIGPISSLHLVRHPLTATELWTKRAIDLLGAGSLLICLMPLFVLAALAIRLDSPGPVFFAQRRYGFNQQEFTILKFRSMHVADGADGSALRQARRGDPRVTRLGRWMRRSSLDELPQLLNVLRGEMSLVGPRPHALDHNYRYERSIAAYARRHNVKPGITGWAQIHGLRGETASEAVMRARVEHDLFYIDNWSLGLDLRILGRTATSLQVHANAY